MEHVWHSCDKDDCFVCRGGLAMCKICGGLEGSLTEECCGRLMTMEEREKVYAGEVDFVNDEWGPKVKVQPKKLLACWVDGWVVSVTAEGVPITMCKAGTMEDAKIMIGVTSTVCHDAYDAIVPEGWEMRWVDERWGDVEWQSMTESMRTNVRRDLRDQLLTLEEALAMYKGQVSVAMEVTRMAEAGLKQKRWTAGEAQVIGELMIARGMELAQAVAIIEENVEKAKEIAWVWMKAACVKGSREEWGGLFARQ